MAGTFISGKTKIRPGTYYNIQKYKSNAPEGSINGVTAAVFRSDFGPVGKVLELHPEDGYEAVFGTALTADVIKEVFAGGANTVLACRLGTGGSQAGVTLKGTVGDGAEADAVKITAKYPGEKSFTVTVRDQLTDDTLRECIIHTGTSVFERVEFAAGEKEAQALAEAFSSSVNFTAEVLKSCEEAVMSAVSQEQFVSGSNPEVTNESYSDAFAVLEQYEFNSICVDTENTAVHLLLQSFMDRIFNAGSLAQAVVAEKHTVSLEKREAHAAAFNDEKMNYVLNAYVSEQGTEIDGYQTAARIAGMIGAVNSGTTLTHTVIDGFSELLERLTNTQITEAEKNGCIVLSLNSERQVWIDNAINTLTVPADNQDDGWKKIRRVKTRFELIRRVNDATDKLKVDNDSNGRATVMSRISGVGGKMITEGKLNECKVTESSIYKADGDSAWFDIGVIDKDSMEHIYLTYLFRFNTNIKN